MINTNEYRSLNVYIANLGKYNEGELVGGWISLPVEEEKMQNFLKEVVKTDGAYEEYAIHDHERAICSIHEYENLYELNTMMYHLNELSDEHLKKVVAYTHDMEIDTPLHIVNVALQADDIAFYAYDFKGVEHCENLSNAEKYGYTMAEEFGFYNELDNLNVDHYFDFESYGRSFELSGEVTLFDEGYLSIGNDINLELYEFDSKGTSLQGYDEGLSL